MYGLRRAHLGTKLCGLICNRRLKMARLEDSDTKVRRVALQKLGKLNADALKAHETAIAAKLEDPDADVRITALETLGKLNAEALKAHAPAIVAKLEDSRADVRRAALQKLGKLNAARVRKPQGCSVKCSKSVVGVAFVDCDGRCRL